MKLYRAPDGTIHGYEPDGSQDYLIPDTYVQLTEEEIQNRDREARELELASEAIKQAEDAARQNALNKLMALGLTEEEAVALIK